MRFKKVLSFWANCFCWYACFCWKYSCKLKWRICLWERFRS